MIEFVLIFFASLWDVYLQGAGVRPLDLLIFALVLIFLGYVILKNLVRISVSKFRIFLFVLLFFLFYASVGFIFGGETIKPGLGVLGGFLFMLTVMTLPLSSGALLRAINITILIHSVAVLLQVFVYHVLGEYYNIYSPLGLEPRVFSSVYRPSGLMLEPAAHCMSIIILLLMKSCLGEKMDKVSFIGLVGMILTNSLWGYISGIVYLCINGWWLQLALAAVPLAVLASAYNLVYYELTFARLFRLDSDGSANARFSGLFTEDLTSLQSLFGKGISYSYIDFGSSGVGFALNAFGLIGTLVLFLVFYFSLDKLLKAKEMTILAIVLIAAPMWTIYFFWLALGVIFIAKRKRVADSCLIDGRKLKSSGPILRSV